MQTQFGMPWSDEDAEKLLKLSEEGKSLDEIASIMGRKAGAIRTKLKRLRPGVSLKRVAWTEEDKALLVELKERFGLGWSEIANRLDRPSGTCYTKYKYLKHIAAPKGPRVLSSNGMLIPEAVLADRDRRQAAPLTISAFVLGDPPKGFSALDRKLEGVGA